MPPPELPGEITDHIISDVWPDKPSLLNCALVCSRWLPASRHHLFKQLHFPSRTSYDLLVSRVLHSQSMKPWLASVDSVVFIEYEMGKSVRVPLEAGKKVGPLFLRDFIGHLPNMRSLRFQEEDWILSSPRRTTFAAFSQFPSLSSLELFDCKFPSFAALRQMLSALPALSSLMINNVYWPSSIHPQSVSSVRIYNRPRVETLFFVMEGTNHCAREFMDWLVHTASRSSIRHLEVFRGRNPSTDPWSVLSAYSHVFAASVDSLRITYMENRLASLSDFTNLTHLSIDILEFVHGWPNWQRIAQLLQILRCPLIALSISSWYMDQVSYARVSVPERSSLTRDYDDGLEILDAVLEHRRFHHLKSISFSLDLTLSDAQHPLALRPAHTQQGLNVIIQRKLPKLVKRVEVKAFVQSRVTPVPIGEE